MKNIRTISLRGALALAAVTALGACAGAEPSSDGGGAHLYMDMHELGAGNVTAEAVAEAHRADLDVQARHGVRFLRYWVDEANGQVYCLSEAPSPEAVVQTHREAHGLLPDSIGEVTTGQ